MAGYNGNGGALAPTHMRATPSRVPEASLHRRLLTLVLIAISAIGLQAWVAAPAGAEITDAPQNYWGVDGLDPNSTTNVNSQVWAIEQIDNTIYVGGKFLQVVGNTTYSQPYLAAFHADTGRWIDWWRPTLNGSVFALEASADGSRLFVGGEFTQVNGQTWNGFASLNPVSGATMSWPTRISGGSPAVVRTMDIEGEWLYLGGAFTTVAENGAQEPAFHSVRMNRTTGAVDSTWKPVVEGGGVWGMAASPDTPRVYITGFFDAVNGDSDAAWGAALNDVDGAPVPGLVHQSNTTNANFRYQHDVEVANGHVFIGGSQHNVHVYRESDFELLKTHMTKSGGDIQDMELVGDRLYVTCHCFGDNYEYDGLQIWPTPNPAAVKTPVRAVFAIDTITGSQDPSFQMSFTGAAGAWAVHGHSTDGCVWMGGDMTTSGGTGIKRLARLCDSAGPGPSAGPRLTPPPPAACAAVEVGTNDVSLTWPSVPYASDYVVYRNNVWLAKVPASSLSYTDLTPAVGPTYTYSVATQSGGVNSNPRQTCNPSITFAPDTPVMVSSCAVSESGGSASVSWVRAGNDNASAFIVYRSRDGGQFYWRAKVNVPGTSFVDGNVSAGSSYTYRILTQGAGQNSAPRGCSPSVTIGAGSAPVTVASCDAVAAGGNRVVSWVRAGNDNAERFIIHRSRNGGPFYWLARVDIPGTSYTDSSVVAGSTYAYRVTTQGGGVNSAFRLCT